MRLGITRSAKDLGDILERTQTKELRIVPLPLVTYTPVDFHLPNEMRPQASDWLIFTSPRGVDYFIGLLGTNGIQLSKGVKIGVVGARTAEAVKKYGFAVAFLPSIATSEILFEEFISQHPGFSGKVLYASASDISFDPEKLFCQAGINYLRLIVYHSQPAGLKVEVLSQFSGDDAILFTSPMAVKVFAQNHGVPIPRAIAIGIVTERAMKEQGWEVESVLTEPNIQRAVNEIGAAI